MNKQEYLELIQPAIELVVAKHKDYDEGGVKLEDYFPFGDPSYVQMLHVKTMRLVSLTASGNTPTHESLKDTVLDLINYSVFYLKHLEDGDERK